MVASAVRLARVCAHNEPLASAVQLAHIVTNHAAGNCVHAAGVHRVLSFLTWVSCRTTWNLHVILLSLVQCKAKLYPSSGGHVTAYTPHQETATSDVLELVTSGIPRGAGAGTRGALSTSHSISLFLPLAVSFPPPTPPFSASLSRFLSLSLSLARALSRSLFLAAVGATWSNERKNHASVERSRARAPTVP